MPSRQPSRTVHREPYIPYSARASRANISAAAPNSTKGGSGKQTDKSGKSGESGKKKSAEMESLCGQAITIPPQLPDILKQYAKGAMRTQPPDLLRWSGAYFRAMANGEVLPVKDKLEYPLKESTDGLTAGLLRVIDAQLGGQSGQKVATNEVLKRWRGLGLSPDGLTQILQKAQMADGNVVEWDKLMTVMASTIGTSLSDTMGILCEVLTDQGEGMEPLVNFTVWWNSYAYLVQMSGRISSDAVQSVKNYLQSVSKENSGLIGPKDFNGPKCPPLE